MKVKVKAKAFNGMTLTPSVAIHLDGMIAINSLLKHDGVIATSVYSDVQSKLLDIFSQLFASLEIKSVDFNIISKDLENLKRSLITPDSDCLAEKIYQIVINSLCTLFNIDKSLPLKERLNQLSMKDAEFRRVFINEDIIDIPINKDLLRVSELYNNKKYPEATQLLSSISHDSLSSDEIDEISFLNFSLLLKNTKEKDDKLFQENVAKYNENPKQAKLYYFEYIKFCENIRDTKKPRNLLKEFESKYPLSILSKEELSIYYYLKARAEYGRGEYLVALDYFSKSMDNIDKNDKKLLATVYNSAVNSFTDNLFFCEANLIANKALEIRTLLDLPEKQETISCLGGIALKSGNYKEAFDKFKEAEELSNTFTLTDRDKNRLLNYIAKSAIFLDKFIIAEEYLNKAKVSGDAKGYSRSIHLLLFLKQKKYSEMLELYKTSIMLPENHRDYDDFALAWGYTFMAQAAFEQQKFKDGVKFLFYAVNFFLGDFYILEAAYISLYLFAYSVPKTHIKTFRKLEPKYSIMTQFGIYVQKHSIIAEKFFKAYDSNIQKTENISILKNFYNDIKHINDKNYNPEDVKVILDSICLI